MVKVLTLNVRGIKATEKQHYLAIYAQRQKADILLLQETNLSDTALTSTLHPYHIIINPAIQSGSGTALAIHVRLHPHTHLHAQQILVPGYLQSCHITLNGTEFQLINVYMPINTPRATDVAKTLKTHIKALPTNRTVLLGGDWNVTLSAQDRQHHTEKRTVLAEHIGNLMQTHQLIDVWRSFHPESKQFTYCGNQSTHPRSRLDRIYISKTWIHRTHSAYICPYFVDHAGLSINLLPHQEKHRPAFWRFQNHLLNDTCFMDFTTTITKYYATSATETEDIVTLWDEMKQEIKLQSQRYESHKKQRKHHQYTELEQQIHHLTEKQHLTEAEEQVLNITGTTLRNKYQQEANRRILLAYSANQHPTKAYLPLLSNQKGHTPTPRLQAIRIQDALLTEPRTIRVEVKNYYQDLFSTKGNDPTLRDDIFTKIPALETDEREQCDAPLTLSELTAALQTTNLGKSPGLDGLTYEFYKKFWKELGPLFVQVANASLQAEKLPSSMLNGVITLVPKQGDPTLLTSWRPITLLNTDYKLIARCLASRITKVLPRLITSDQSFCIPNRTIHTNLHLIRDAIAYANHRSLPLAVVSLDQASAYDCVEHPYIFYVLHKFGFGAAFISFVRAMYSHAQSVVNLNGTLTAPFHCARGVRQGDPLSGPLFALTIEPFLLLCNQNLQNYGLQLPRIDYTDNNPTVDNHNIHNKNATVNDNNHKGHSHANNTTDSPHDTNNINSNHHNRTLVTTAYADDVTIFLSANEGFPQLLNNFTVYGDISGAKLNAQKSTGLFAGSWKHRTDHPLGFRWNGQGGKYLGIYLGNSATWHQQNWTQLATKIQVLLARWKKHPRATSYQDRKTILNQLIGAKLTHVITILPPTDAFLKQIHKLFVHFIWQGRHWKHPNFVYGRQEDGGIGVFHLPTRVQTLRFHFLQKFVENTDRGNAWCLQAHNISMYDPALRAEDVLKLHLNLARCSAMQPFYANALAAWNNIHPIQNPNLQSFHDIHRTPIQNSTLLTPHISGRELHFDCAWSTLNISYVGELLTANGQWKSIDAFNTELCTQPTIRRLQTNLRKADAFFRHHYPNLSSHPPHPPLSSPTFVVKTLPNKLTPLPIPRRTIYHQLLPLNLDNHAPVNGECYWKLGTPNWKAVYHPPILSQDGDIAWRILHNRIATPEQLNKWNQRQTADCPWCPRSPGTLEHMLFECSTVTATWARLQKLLHKLLGPHPLNRRLLLYGYSNLQNAPRHLANYLIVLAKTTIYKTYLATINHPHCRPPDYWRMFRMRLQYRLHIEIHHSIWSNDMEHFRTYWLHANILGKQQDGKIVLNEELFP
jgi:exonuclease III